MKWLIGIVVLALLVVSVRFRKFVLGFVALGAAVGGVVYLINEREESRSLSRIPVSQLIFENVMLSPDYSGYKISGRIKNTSAQFTLKEVTYIVTMQDCTGELPSKSCVTIGESRETVYLNVPPGQARDFEDSVYLGGTLKPKARLEWHYVVSETKGE
jgi:hypothetical protein